jgi:hypothetical protein
VADILKTRLGIDVDLVPGKPGEFSVWVGDRRVAKKLFFWFPRDEYVVDSVASALRN